MCVTKIITDTSLLVNHGDSMKSSVNGKEGFLHVWIREVRDDDGLCNRGSREGMKSEVSVSFLVCLPRLFCYLRCNSHILKSTLLKYAIQWFFVYSLITSTRILVRINTSLD